MAGVKSPQPGDSFSLQGDRIIFLTPEGQRFVLGPDLLRKLLAEVAKVSPGLLRQALDEAMLSQIEVLVERKIQERDDWNGKGHS